MRFSLALRRVAVVLSLGLLSATAVRAEPVTVFAAASLKDALDAVSVTWRTAGYDAPVLGYGATPAMAAQILAGAPADIFIAASPEWMDEVQAAGLVVAGTRRDLLGNTLVLVAHRAEAAPVGLIRGLDLLAVPGSGRLAMAMVDAVPAGVYGRQALTSLGLWDRVAPRVAQTESVRAALALVAAGEAPLGIVYGSDAVAARAAGEAVGVVATFPPGSHAAIVYPVALVRDTPGAREFLAYLSSPAARAAFEAQGFRVLP